MTKVWTGPSSWSSRSLSFIAHISSSAATRYPNVSFGECRYRFEKPTIKQKRYQEELEKIGGATNVKEGFWTSPAPPWSCWVTSIREMCSPLLRISLRLACVSDPCELIRDGAYLNRTLGPRDEHVRCRKVKGLDGGDAAWTDFPYFLFLETRDRRNRLSSGH